MVKMVRAIRNGNLKLGCVRDTADDRWADGLRSARCRVRGAEHPSAEHAEHTVGSAAQRRWRLRPVRSVPKVEHSINYDLWDEEVDRKKGPEHIPPPKARASTPTG